MSLATRLAELALERRLNWQETQGVLEAAEREEQARERLERLLVAPSLPSVVPEATERDVALRIHLRELLGLPETESTATWREAFRDFWAGATAEEAFCLNLRIGTNPGDNSGIRHRAAAQLLGDLEVLRALPKTRWRRRRVFVTYRELRRRERGGALAETS